MMLSDTACAVASTVRFICSTARNRSWRWRNSAASAGRDPVEIDLARPDPRGVGDIHAGQFGLRRFELGRLGELAGAHQRGFLLDGAEQRLHHLQEVPDQRLALGRTGDRMGRALRRVRRSRCSSDLLLRQQRACTSLAMPMPPALTKDLEYSSVRNDRQMLAPWPPLNGPSPTPENICWNMLLRNTASKSSPAALALAARPAAASEPCRRAPRSRRATARAQR